MFLERISYPEVEAYLRKSQTILLPVGSLENHGKHMPLGTDTLIPEHLCSLLDARFPELLIAPPLHYGATEDLRGFPGTISIGVEGLRMLLTLIVDQLFGYGFPAGNKHREEFFLHVLIAAAVFEGGGQVDLFFCRRGSFGWGG